MRTHPKIAAVILALALIGFGAAGVWAYMPSGPVPANCERITFQVPRPFDQPDQDRFNRMSVECPNGWRPRAYAD